MDRLAEGALVLDGIGELVELPACAALDDRAPDVDDLLGGGGDLQAAQALAHHHGHSVLQRGVGAVGDLSIGAAMVAVLQHGPEIGGDAFHAPCADGFHPRLLNRIEDRAGLLPLGHEALVHICVMAGHAQGHGIRMAAHDGRLARGELARGLGQARLGAITRAREGGSLGGEGHLEVAVLGHGPQAARHGPFERLLRGFGLLRRLAVGAHGVRSARRSRRFRAIPVRSNADRTPPPADAPVHRTC